MTIDIDAAGTLAQVYAIALLILALEGRFLRLWVGGRFINTLRVIWTVAGLIALILTLVAEGALVQAVIYGEEVSPALSCVVILAGWSLTLTVGAFLGGAMVEATSLGAHPKR